MTTYFQKTFATFLKGSIKAIAFVLEITEREYPHLFTPKPTPPCRRHFFGIVSEKPCKECGWTGKFVPKEETTK